MKKNGPLIQDRINIKLCKTLLFGIYRHLEDHLQYPTVLFRVSYAWKDHTGGQLNHRGTPLDMCLQQQVVILSIDLFPGDSRGGGPVCSVSGSEAAAGKQYSTSSFAVTTKREAPVSALIMLFSLR